MKKALIAAALISGLTISTGAFAAQGEHAAHGDMPKSEHGAAHQQLSDQDIQAKVEQFYKDTRDLRRQMAVKQAEKRAMMMHANPDPAAAGQLAGELFDLHTTMTEKAKEAGVDQYVGHGMRQKAGMKKGKMMHGGDKGMMHGGGKGMMHGGGKGKMHGCSKCMMHGGGHDMDHGEQEMSHGEGSHGTHNMPAENQDTSNKI